MLKITPPYTPAIIDEEGLTTAVSESMDLGTLPVRLSVNVVAENGAADAKGFLDGVLASGTLTVASYALLLPASATATITVVDYSALTAAVLTVNGTALTEGVEWTAAVDNDTTAASLELAIEAVTGISSVAAANVITATVVATGTAGNAFTLTTSDAVNLTISGALFAGGRDAGTVTVAGQVLTAVAAGPGANQFVAATSNDVTADNLAAAIDSLASVTAANPAAAVITVKAATVGVAGNSIGLVVSASNSGVTRSGATLTGGLANAVNAVDFEITIASHGFSSGLKVNYDVLAGTTLDNLVNNTDYFVIKVDDNTIQLSATSGGAVIEIAAADDAVGGGSFTLTPTAVDVDVLVSGSNDAEEWIELDSDTLSAEGSLLYEYPTISFRYIKVDVEPNDSEIDLRVIVHTKL